MCKGHICNVCGEEFAECKKKTKEPSKKCKFKEQRIKWDVVVKAAERESAMINILQAEGNKDERLISNIEC